MMCLDEHRIEIRLCSFRYLLGVAVGVARPVVARKLITIALGVDGLSGEHLGEVSSIKLGGVGRRS